MKSKDLTLEEQENLVVGLTKKITLGDLKRLQELLNERGIPTLDRKVGDYEES